MRGRNRKGNSIKDADERRGFESALNQARASRPWKVRSNPNWAWPRRPCPEGPEFVHFNEARRFTSAVAPAVRPEVFRSGFWAKAVPLQRSGGSLARGERFL